MIGLEFADPLLYYALTRGNPIWVIGNIIWTKVKARFK
jgi:hypothetical protein